MDAETASPASSAWPLAGFCCFLFAVAIVGAGGALEFPRYEATFTKARVFFPDPDDYTRTYRAKKVLSGETLRPRHMPSLNHPAGVEMHWAVVMDYLLAGAGVLGMGLFRHPDRVGVAAAWVPVLLGLGYVTCMIGWIRRCVGWGPALLTGMVVIVSPAFHRPFQLGHPDHHALLELLFVIAIGAWAPGVRDDAADAPPTRRAGRISGLAIGFAIWMSSLSLLVWAAILIGLHSAHRSCHEAARPAIREAAASWRRTVAGVVIIGFLVENWPDLGTVSLDKISTVHLALAVIAFLVPTGRPSSKAERIGERETEPHPEVVETAPEQQRRTTQTVVFLLAVAIFTVWMAVAFEKAVEPVARPEVARWHEHNAELQPLFAHVDEQWSLKPLHDRLGYLPYALPALLPLFLISKRVPLAIKCMLGLLAPILAVLTLFQVRWMDHYNLAVAPVAVIGLWEGLHRFIVWSPRPRPVLCFAASGLLLGLLTWPAAATILGRTTKGQLAGQAPLARTDFVGQQISRFEEQHGPPTSARQAILCEEGEGPMLLYDTGRPVVAAPYHRAIDGIVEAARFYAETDPHEARAQLDRLGIRYVVMPYRAHEQLMMFEHIAFGALRSFDRPEEAINELGRIMLTLTYRQEKVMQTMAYRLVMKSNAEVIPGVAKIAEIDEGAVGSDGQPMRTGLLYVVHELSDAMPASPAAP